MTRRTKQCSIAVAFLLTAPLWLGAAVWTGAGADNFWTTPGNWQGGIVPANGDAVTFGLGFVQGTSVKYTNYWTGAPVGGANMTQSVWQVELPPSNIYINGLFLTNTFPIDQLALHNEDATLVLSNGVETWCAKLVNAKCKVRFDGDQALKYNQVRLEYWGNVENQSVLTKLGSQSLRFRNAGTNFGGTIIVDGTGALQGGFASDYSIGTATIIYTNTASAFWGEILAAGQEIFIHNNFVYANPINGCQVQSTGPPSGRPSIMTMLGNISGTIANGTQRFAPRVNNYDCMLRLKGTNTLSNSDVLGFRTDSDGIIELYLPEAAGDQNAPPNWIIDYDNGYGVGVFLCAPFTVNNIFELGNTRTNGQYAGVYGIQMLGGFHAAGTATFAGEINLRRTHEGYVAGSQLLTQFATTSATARTVFSGYVYDTSGFGPVTLEINRYRTPLTNILDYSIGRGTVELAYNNGNSYRGGTIVHGGTLVVNNSSGSATGTGDVSVLTGAALAGAGIIAGGVAIADNATLAPGNSAGTLTVGSLALNSSSILNYQLGSQAPGDYDQVAVNSDLTLDGTINIAALPGFANGTYTAMTYVGTCTDNGLTVGTTPPATIISIVHDPTAKAVLITVSAPAPPTAQITEPAGPTSILLGASIAFAGVGTTGSAAITGYRWEFGDGVVTSGVALTSVVHTYAATNVCTAKFVVTDANAYEGYDQRVITVNARVTATITQPAVPWAHKNATVHFEGSGTAQGSTITNYIWDLGDGTVQSGPALTSVDHSYAAAGLVTTVFSVVNSLGDIATASMLLDIVAPISVYDGFDYASGEDLAQVANAGGGWGFAAGAAWTNGSYGPGLIAVTNYGLTYVNPGDFDLQTIGLCVVVSSLTNAEVTRPLLTAVQAPRTAGPRTFWLSFLINDLSGDLATSGSCYTALATGANPSEWSPVVTIGKTWNGKTFVNRPYVFTSSTSGFGPNPYLTGTNYLLVGKLTLSMTDTIPRRTFGQSEWWAYQSGQDSLPIDEPTSGVLREGTNGSGAVVFQHLVLLNPPFGGEYCKVAMDELRLGETWQEVIPLVPEPALLLPLLLVLGCLELPGVPPWRGSRQRRD
ncbi:MAG: PKD domain-containing protein [bacterium]|nr:PKD domain-containing protein [bacterium]